MEIVPAKVFFETGDLLECESIFYSKRWVNVLAAAYDFDIQAIVDPHTRQYVLFSVHDDFLGKRLLSLPFSDYILPDVEPGFLPPFIEAAAEAYAGHSIVYKADGSLAGAFVADDWAVTREALYHRVDIQDEGAMWKRLSSAFRRGVQKAEKSKVQTVIRHDIEAVNRFYELHSQLRKKKFHSLPQPLSFFHALHQEFISQQLGFVLEATCEDQLLASIIVLIHKRVLYYKFGASAPEFLERRPNNLLFWQLLLYAFENGYVQLDLGLSGKSQAYDGLIRFKEGLGGKPRSIMYFRKDPPHYEQRKEQEFKKLLSGLTNLFIGESSDIELARKAGQLLYCYFA